MLAQLQMAAGLENVVIRRPDGKASVTVFGNAAGAYDLGFTKYSRGCKTALTATVSRWKGQMAYDTARRQAALGLFTTAAEERSASIPDHELMGRHNMPREWDAYKLAVGRQGPGGGEDWHTRTSTSTSTKNSNRRQTGQQTRPYADPMERKKKEEKRRMGIS